MKIELTIFTKSGGPLTKRISLAPDGSIKSDGSACIMANGIARRMYVDGVAELATSMGCLAVNDALELGHLRSGLPDEVRVATKSKLNGGGVNGVIHDIIARTGKDIVYRKGQQGFCLVDYDVKGMPTAVAAELKQHGSFWRSMCTVLPDLANVARVMRRSTSAGLYREDTGEHLRGSDGIHAYLAVKDTSDIERFLRVLHERCWLAGLGWHMISTSGQLLDRSIVDRMVGRPERLIFEGTPILDPPLKQDATERRPVAFDGGTLDTLAACPPLTIAELAKLRELKAKTTHALKGEATKARTAFINKQAERLAKRTGMASQAAKQMIARQCEEILLPDIELPFDDEALAGCTVADVLADPDRFEGETLADPLEGVEYGRCKAKVMRRPDGSSWIHSFAHGRVVYELKYSVKAVRALLAKTERGSMVETFIRLALLGDLAEDELDAIREEVAIKTDAKTSTIKRMLKQAFATQREKHKVEEHERRLAERRDPRPVIKNPEMDAPWLPMVGLLNEIVDARTNKPKVRDIEDSVTKPKRLAFPSTHAFEGAN